MVKLSAWLSSAVYTVGSGVGLLLSLLILAVMVIAIYETIRYFGRRMFR